MVRYQQETGARYFYTVTHTVRSKEPKWRSKVEETEELVVAEYFQPSN